MDNSLPSELKMAKKPYSLNKESILGFLRSPQSLSCTKDDSSQQTASGYFVENADVDGAVSGDADIIPDGSSLDDLSITPTTMDSCRMSAEIRDTEVESMEVDRVLSLDELEPRLSPIASPVTMSMPNCSPPLDLLIRHQSEYDKSQWKKECSDLPVKANDWKYSAGAGCPQNSTSTHPPQQPSDALSKRDQYIHDVISVDKMDPDSMYRQVPSPTHINQQMDTNVSVKPSSLGKVQKPSSRDSTEVEEEDGYPVPVPRKMMEEMFEESHKDDGCDVDVASQPVFLRVRGLKKSVSRDVVLFFFENNRRSGGGLIEDIEYIPEKEEAIIRFLEEDSVEGVLASGPDFVVEGVSLTVERFIPPKPLPVEPLMLLISGIKRGTTDECLSNFLESKSEALPVNIEYRANQSTALVTFDEEPNFEKLCHACSTRTLEGNTLTVSKVVITNCVKVIGFEPGTPNDTLLYYFENSRRSGGGPIDRIIDDHIQGCSLVYFENNADAVAVSSTDRTHVVDGITFSVSLYYDCPEENSGVISSFCLPEPVVMADVSLQIVHFLKNSLPNRKIFENILKKCHAEISWPKNQDTDSLTFLCTITSDDENAEQLVVEWPDQVISVAKKQFAILSEKELSTIKEAWNEVIKKLERININHPDGVAIVTKKNVCTINIVGHKRIVDKLQAEVSELIQETEQCILQVKQNVTKTKKLKTFQIILLRATKFTKDMEQEFPNVKITAELDSGEVVFYGSPKDIDITQIKMFQLLNSFASKRLELSKESRDLLFVKDTRDYVKKRMMKCNVIGAWEVVRGEQGIKLYGRSDAEVKQAIEIMTRSIKEGVIRIPKLCQAAFKSAAWTDLKNRMVTSNCGRICVCSGKESVFYVATDDIFSEIHKEITSFLDLHVVEKELIPLPKGVIRFLKKYRNTDLRNIESSLEKLNVCIQEADSGKGMLVKGNTDGIKLTRMKIAELEKSICRQEHCLSRPGVGNFFSTAKGLDVIKFVEAQQSCIIERKMTEGVSHSSLQKPVYKAEYVFHGGRKIVVAEGDMTQLDVDVITNAASNDMNHQYGLAKFIVNRAGAVVQNDCTAYVKAKGRIPDGHVIRSGPGKLSCKMIIHAVGPRWTGGHKEEEKLLQQAVENTLKFAAHNKFNSVAIPALSTGMNKYPIDQEAQTIVDSIQRYWFMEGPSQTSVTVVYLSSIDRSTIKAFTDALQQITGGIFCHLHNGGDDLDISDSDSNDSTVSESYEELEDQEFTDILDWVPVKGATVGESVGAKPSKIRIQIVTGELAQQTVDVIVNTVRPDLKLDLGVLSKSLLMAGGQVLQTDCKRQYPQGILPGGIAVTRGGNLSCKNVYHGSLIGWDSRKGKAEPVLRSMMSSCLIQTSINNMSSIAFPAMGTGGLGFPADIVASTMFDCVRQFDQQNTDTSIKDVIFVLYPKDMAVIKAFGSVEEKQQLDSGIKRSKNGSSSQTQSADSVSYRQPQSSDSMESVHHPVSYKLGQVTLELIQGDITKQTTDVIVNSTLENLDLSKGAVSNAVLKAAGRSIQEECNSTANKTKIKQDGFVLTSAGRLQCSVIMHVKSRKTPESWRRVVSKCLEETDKMQFRSISIPALGTGSKGCDLKAVAEAITGAIFESASSRKLRIVRLVRLVVFQLEMLNIFKSVLQAKSGQKQKSSFPARPACGKKSDKQSPVDSVTFVILSHSMDSIRSAASILNDNMDKEFTDKQISEPYREVIKQLKPYQVSKVMTLGEDKETKVTVIIERGQIKLNGRSEQVMKANDAIAHYLRNIENDKHKNEISKFMKVQWYYIVQQSKDMRKFSPEQNADIEMAYTQKKPTVDVKDKSGVTYRINFSSMTEYVLSSPRNKIPVIRSDLSQSAGTPHNWSAMNPGEDVKVVPLSSNDPEYKKIEQTFLNSSQGTIGMAQKITGFLQGMTAAQSSRTIIKINRIQNRSLYQQFLSKRKQIEQQTQTRPVDHMLWHGTSSDVVKSINHNGFDRGYCGKHGTAHGAGVYFAVNASYPISGTFCSPDTQGHRHIYFAQVLTGDSVQGSSNMKVLPQKNPITPHIHYDSAVDAISNTGVYIIFHDSQAYPKYHIVFK